MTNHERSLSPTSLLSTRLQKVPTIPIFKQPRVLILLMRLSFGSSKLSRNTDRCTSSYCGSHFFEITHKREYNNITPCRIPFARLPITFSRRSFRRGTITATFAAIPHSDYSTHALAVDKFRRICICELASSCFRVLKTF